MVSSLRLVGPSRPTRSASPRRRTMPVHAGRRKGGCGAHDTAGAVAGVACAAAAALANCWADPREEIYEAMTSRGTAAHARGTVTPDRRDRGGVRRTRAPTPRDA